MAFGGFEERREIRCEERRENRFTSVGVILVLFILLVIIARAWTI